jgi:uncharacterized NAD-dependent epimerase/dehydratase family protein
LLHGAQPDAIVLCHEAGRTLNSDFVDLLLPELEECAELNLRMARMVNPDVFLAGISLNTSGLSEPEAQECLRDVRNRLAVPAIDPSRNGVGEILAVLP